MKKEKITLPTEVEISDIRKRLIDRIVDKYGSIWNFITSEDGEKFGGKKLQPYLSVNGPISYNKFRALMKFFKMGNLQKETTVVRTTKYFLS